MRRAGAPPLPIDRPLLIFGLVGDIHAMLADDSAPEPMLWNPCRDPFGFALRGENR